MAISSGSFLLDLLGVLTALGAILYVYLKWSFQYWKKKNVPYLEPKVPFGNFMNPYTKTINETTQVKHMYEQAKLKGWKYCGIYNMAIPNLLLLDLELIKHVLTKDFDHFTDRGVYINEKDDPISGHLFSIGGLKWRNLRTKLSPTFSSGKMRMMFQTLADSGAILEKYFDEVVSGNKTVDVKEVLGQYATDNIGSCAFGIECNSFKEPNSPFRLYGKRALQQTKLESLKIGFCQNFPEIGHALGVTVFPKEVSQFYTKIVSDVVHYREENKVTRRDFLQLLIENKHKAQEDDGLGGDESKLTMDEIIAQCFVFFIAGFETSSTTSSFALYELTRQPEVQDKVREEIQAVLKKHNNQLTYDGLNEMKYMKQVIDETLRKYPAVPFITRQCVKDYKVPGEDFVIEKGTMVIIPIEAIHYDEMYYKDPTKFDPDRFSEENKKNRHTYTHLPFGGGPRTCIGERFGILQTKVGLVSALKNYKIRLNEKTKVPLKLKTTSFVPNVDGGIWLTFNKV